MQTCFCPDCTVLSPCLVCECIAVCLHSHMGNAGCRLCGTIGLQYSPTEDHSIKGMHLKLAELESIIG